MRTKIGVLLALPRQLARRGAKGARRWSKRARRGSRYLTTRRRARVGAARFWLHENVVGNPAASRRHRRQAPPLTETQQRCLEDLRRDGISTVPFNDLIGSDELWASLESDMAEFVREAEQEAARAGGEIKSKGDYLVRGYEARLNWQRRQRGEDVAPVVLPVEGSWLRVATRPEVLGVVNSYRDLQTKLVDLDKWYTVAAEQQRRVSSQRWHRDPDDRHVVKMFIYFSDVDDGAGPFEYLAGSAEGGRNGDLNPWAPSFEGRKRLPRRNRAPQAVRRMSRGELEDAIPEGDIVSAQGPRGTLIFADTSGLHRGGFALERPRVLTMCTYVSPAAAASPLAPRYFSVDWNGSRAGLSEASRFALS